MKQAKQILVVEDDFSIRVLLQEILLDLGYKVVASERGREALKLVNEEKIDLITLDLGLPDMSGSDFLAQLSKKGSTHEFPPPIVVISANPHQLQPHPHPFVKTIISKPFNIDQIVEVVEKCLV